jgi:hypothetical protein
MKYYITNRYKKGNHVFIPRQTLRSQAMDIQLFISNFTCYFVVEATLADLKSKFEEEMQDLKDQIQKMRE